MSMLAEPRYKQQKWGANPRGTLWTEDDNKFGQKLMEKMGWTKGRGLGKDEQGDLDTIAVRIKNNTKGIGYEGKDDTWIKHYESFENVLATLNSENSTPTTPCSSAPNSNMNSDDEDQKPFSLEALSKKSTARVHYHKFTRGKDLSRIDADTIGMITGSKRAKILADIAKKDKYIKGEVGSEEHNNGITTVNGGNLKEYFAKKMALLREQQSSQHLNAATAVDIEEREGQEEDFMQGESLSWKDSKKKKAAKGLQEVEKCDDEVEACADSQGKREKKKRKNKNKREHEEKNDGESAEKGGKNCDEEPRSKKKKGNIDEVREVEKVAANDDEPCDKGESLSWKDSKKKRKAKGIQEAGKYDDEVEACSDSQGKREKKKRKNKNKREHEEENDGEGAEKEGENCDEEPWSKKKKGNIDEVEEVVKVAANDDEPHDKGVEEPSENERDAAKVSKKKNKKKKKKRQNEYEEC